MNILKKSKKWKVNDMKEKKVFNVDKFNEGLAAVHKRTEEELQ